MSASRTARVGIGLLILFEAFLIAAPLTVLGGAIEWPSSLDFAPSKVLPLIVEQADAVRLGYGIYLGYSLLFAFVGTAIAWLAVRGTDGERSPLLTLAIALAAASALARAIGIIRWLAGSLALGEAWTANDDPATRAALEAAQLATNGWGGAVGELLGVALIAGLWLAVVSVLILRHGALPRWLGWSGLAVAAVVSMPAGELVGLSLVGVSTSTTVLHLWFLAVGIASLLDKKLVTLQRIAQDGMRVRASAKAASCRRRPRLERLLVEARTRVAILKQELSGDGLTQRQKAARKRAVTERERRLVEALATMERIEIERAPKRKRSPSDGADDPPGPPGSSCSAASDASGADPAAGTEAGGKKKRKPAEPRVSTTDPETRVMKMADGGFRPAFNIQLAVDVDTRLVLGVDVLNLGSDMGQMQLMYGQLAERYGVVPAHWLVDGGYANLEAITALDSAGTKVIAPVAASRKGGIDPHAPKSGDSEAVGAWRERMGGEQARALYKWRAATVECVHAHERRRGLGQFPVRGLAKARCVALWHALAHNVLGLRRLGVASAV